MDQLDRAALAAQQDEACFEALVNEQKSFILRCAAKSAGRFLSDSDDEWSIALMAFHEAVKGYREDKGHFSAFASTVIRRRVIDYLRREGRFANEMAVSPETFSGELQADPSALQMEVRDASHDISDLQDEKQQLIDATRAEIEHVSELLKEYGFSFFDLTDCSPKAGKTKEQCKRAVAVLMLIEHPPLMDKLRNTKSLPMKELSAVSGVSKKALERHRKYIIACAEILTGDFPILGEYLSYIKEAVVK